MTWDEYHKDLKATFRGGYHDEKEVEIYRHGMNTVINVFKRRYPQGPPEAQEAKASALSEQVGGTHYKGFKIQPVVFTHVNNIPGIEAAVIWYVCRHKEKNGVQDIDKAIHFLRILKELEYGKEGA